MLFEERHNFFPEMRDIAHPVRQSFGMIAADHATAEELFERVQDLHITFVLDDREFREHLKACFHLGMRIDAHVETAFPIHKSDDPLRFQSRVRRD